MEKLKAYVNVAFLSTYPPRECGIATFTEDLVTTIDMIGTMNTHIITINNDEDALTPIDFLTEIRQHVKNDYLQLANKINTSNIDLLVIEHEYGIFGGENGEYILELLEHLNTPCITTLHTILSTPSDKQRHIIHQLGMKSDKIVTMAQNTKQILIDMYQIGAGKIEVIHHGVTKKPYQIREALKLKNGYENKQIISTFGLLSPGKGIEHGIEAIRKVVDNDKANHPNEDYQSNVLYLILGQTHPALKEEGRAYRLKLETLVQRLHLKDHVRFINKYLTKEEIVNYLQMSDIYMTPYLAKDQAVSGTLAYAVGYGKAIVSTPYLYAQEMLGEGRGLLAEFANPQSLAILINQIFEDPFKKTTMERNTARLGRTMYWDKVANRYGNVILATIQEKSFIGVVL